MPTLHLQVAPLQSPERYQALAQALTRITADTLGKRPDVTAVLIDDLPVARWYVGGQAVQNPTALLTIRVTQGTNTVQEKAAFVAQVFDELQRQLAPGSTLEPASYVQVHELPATDWGYGGVSQQARRLARETAQSR
jgi:4-oxalocrotonate tautomerase